MRISQKLDYAQRAVAHLAQHYDGKTVARLDDIATTQSIPPSFLVQILADLRKASLVISKRGKAGGYLLARSPAHISFADVIDAIEPQLIEPTSAFDGASSPELAAAWKQLSDHFLHQTRALTYDDIIHPNREPMWFI